MGAGRSYSYRPVPDPSVETKAFIPSQKQGVEVKLPMHLQAQQVSNTNIKKLQQGINCWRWTDQKRPFFLYWHEATEAFYYSGGIQEIAYAHTKTQLTDFVGWQSPTHTAWDISVGWVGLDESAYGRNVVLRTTHQDFYLMTQTSEDRDVLTQGLTELLRLVLMKEKKSPLPCTTAPIAHDDQMVAGVSKAIPSSKDEHEHKQVHSTRQLFFFSHSSTFGLHTVHSTLAAARAAAKNVVQPHVCVTHLHEDGKGCPRVRDRSYTTYFLFDDERADDCEASGALYVVHTEYIGIAYLEVHQEEASVLDRISKQREELPHFKQHAWLKVCVDCKLCALASCSRPRAEAKIKTTISLIDE